jgi:hypothetical protein
MAGLVKKWMSRSAAYGRDRTEGEKMSEPPVRSKELRSFLLFWR